MAVLWAKRLSTNSQSLLSLIGLLSLSSNVRFKVSTTCYARLFRLGGIGHPQAFLHGLMAVFRSQDVLEGMDGCSEHPVLVFSLLRTTRRRRYVPEECFGGHVVGLGNLVSLDANCTILENFDMHYVIHR